MNKPRTLGYCRFPLANPHKGKNLDFEIFIESFELSEIILYLLRQSIFHWGAIRGIEIAEM